MSPTQRTLALLRQCGYLAAVVERVVPHCYVKQDLFGIIDVVAIKSGFPILAIQCTTANHISNRRAKDPDMVRKWLSTGAQFELWGWSKRGAAGTRKKWGLWRERMRFDGDHRTVIYEYNELKVMNSLEIKHDGQDVDRVDG